MRSVDPSGLLLSVLPRHDRELGATVHREGILRLDQLGGDLLGLVVPCKAPGLAMADLEEELRALPRVRLLRLLPAAYALIVGWADRRTDRRLRVTHVHVRCLH